MGDKEGGGDCVKVAIRCRPPSTKEINNNESCIVDMNEAFVGSDGENGSCVLNDPSGNEEPSKFAFDIVFGLSVLQETVYESVGRPALAKTFEGFNGTIFAYGQTGSGKSWSMSGAPNPPDLRGITPRMIEALFARIKEEQVGSRKFLVMCSYFEIYNEIIFDLLNPVSDRGKLGGGLQVKEHPVLGIYVKDLTEIVAEGEKKLEDMLDAGNKNRAVSSTMMNASSSRSHSIFTIKVHQKDEEDPSRSIFAKLNLVDLAGSERQKGTGASGQTLKEGANINKSLSALGNVINALVECANGKKVFIPYRNSKLTRVLQESLGGNSLCTMLATLSPAACNYEETMSTLRYANRAKAIKVSATKNEEASQISRLKAEVEELKKKLGPAGTGGGFASASSGLSEAEREAEKEKFEKQLKDMEQMMNSNWGDKAKLSEEHNRKMEKLAEERRRAAQAVEEERARRLKLLQEKNDIELSVRAFTDFLLYIPKFDSPPAVLTGDLPRQWLKTLRTLRQQIDELKEQRTLALVFKHSLHEDVKLWSEGAEAEDLSLAATGLNRCMLKLDKLRMGGERLLQLESQCLGAAAEIAEIVGKGISDVEALHKTVSEVEVSEVEQAAKEDGGKGAALEEVIRMLYMVQKQLQEKVEEVERLASMELGPTGQMVVQFSRKCLTEGELVPEESLKHCDMLEVIIADPYLASLPPSLPLKPLRQYEASDVQDTPETTEALLGQIIRWETLCGGKAKKSASELLARPPPKFILDVTVAVKVATGFPPQMEVDWPEDRNERLARFQHLADAVAADLGTPTDFFEPADVLKGKEVAKTLRLIQLLGVCGAKKLPVPQDGGAGGSTRAKHLPAVMSAMDRCLQAAKETIQARRDAAAQAADGEISLEEQIAEVERQIQEETRLRRRQEEALADTQRQLQEALAEVKKVSNEVELTKGGNDAAGADPEVMELERQVRELLSEAAAPAEMGDEAVLSVLRTQLEEVKKELGRDELSVSSLKERQHELEATLVQVAAEARKAEAELARERQRRESEQELMDKSPEEQRLILQAQEQKLRSRAGALEAESAGMLKETEERKAANLILEQERKELERKTEDAHLQMQIVQEERDAMRDAMEQLWNEKASIDEELQEKMEGYNNLTERLNYKQDETCDLESQVEKLRQEVEIVQRNGFHIRGTNGAVPAEA